MAAVGGPPVVHAGGAPPPLLRNYQDYYADVARDPSNGNYASVMDDFNVPLGGNSRYSPAGLLQRTYGRLANGHTPGLHHVVTSAHMQLPQTLVACISSTGSPTLPLPSADRRLRGTTATFALCGDLVSNQAVIVPWAEAYFSLDWRSTSHP